VESLKELWKALQEIATCAKENGNIRILIDAEYSWYQPAIDALFESCAQQFNKLPSSSFLGFGATTKQKRLQKGFKGPLVYNTLQAYLRRTPSYLAMSLERAKQGNYALGVKLVRGAYVDQENQEWNTKIVPTPPIEGSDSHLASPVWPNKDLTDDCYNQCANLLIKEIAKDVHSEKCARLGVVLAGHNWISNMTAVQTMIDTGLAKVKQEKIAADGENPATNTTLTTAISPFCQLQLQPKVRGRIHFAQLYGMADDLTRALQYSFDNASGGTGPPLIFKYIPYGHLDLVMPYLMRRAKENKSVMGGGIAQKEKSTLAAEMRRRLWTQLF
jgi:proline dehydrogenase